MNLDNIIGDVVDLYSNAIKILTLEYLIKAEVPQYIL